jgi:hypothetical protein
MDVYARAGISRLGIDFPGTAVTDLDGAYKFGGGVGGRLKLVEILSTVALYGEGQGFIFFSEDDVTQDVVGGQMLENQSWEWREAEGAVGVSVNLGRFSIYGGASVSLIETHRDSQKQLIESSGKKGKPTTSPTDEYRSDPLADPGFVGAVFPLPRDFKLNIKLKGPDEVAVYVSLTQLYKGGPGAF